MKDFAQRLFEGVVTDFLIDRVISAFPDPVARFIVRAIGTVIIGMVLFRPSADASISPPDSWAVRILAFYDLTLAGFLGYAIFTGVAGTNLLLWIAWFILVPVYLATAIAVWLQQRWAYVVTLLFTIFFCSAGLANANIIFLSIAVIVAVAALLSIFQKRIS